MPCPAILLRPLRRRHYSAARPLRLQRSQTLALPCRRYRKQSPAQSAGGTGEAPGQPHREMVGTCKRVIFLLPAGFEDQPVLENLTVMYLAPAKLSLFLAGDRGSVAREVCPL